MKKNETRLKKIPSEMLSSPSCDRRTVLLGLAGLAAAGAVAPAAAQSVEEFYKGKVIKVIVGLPPGGVYDISARLMARYLGNYIPGNPTVIVQNLPTAGGLVVANRLYADTSAHDGLTLAVIERSVAQLAVEGDPNAHFDPLKFNWLGSMSSYTDDAYLLLINADHPAKTVADLDTPGMKTRIGGGNAGSSNRHFATIAKDVLGLNIDVVRGYPGATNIFLAMQTGEVDGQVIGYGSSRAGQKNLWDSHKLRPLIQFGRTTRLKDFPDVPTGRELAKTPDALALIEFAELAFFMAMPMLAPPDIPADRAATLKTAFMAMCKDKQFIADANKLSLEVSPLDGDGILKLLTRAAATPKDVIVRYEKLIRS
jgi:tripartite-type tricarboxylate transporter receptor subunit TctC